MPHQKSTPNYFNYRAISSILEEQIFPNRGEAREMLTMRQKMAVTGELQDRYQKSKRREKITILNDLQNLPVTTVVMPVRC